jgi:hypothetical protein
MFHEPPSDFRRKTRLVKHRRLLDFIGRGTRGRILGGVP